MASDQPIPVPFRDALRSIADAHVSPVMRVWETPAPRRIAPYAAAINGEVTSDPDAEGRLVVLFDPAGQDQWHGSWRIVAVIKAVVEPEVGADDLVGSVAWSWLEEALEPAAASHLGGTVTTQRSESFGDLKDRPPSVSLELRASWSPAGPALGAHVEAWLSTMAACAGIPPLPEGVAALPGAL